MLMMNIYSFSVLNIYLFVNAIHLFFSIFFRTLQSSTIKLILLLIDVHRALHVTCSKQFLSYFHRSLLLSQFLFYFDFLFESSHIRFCEDFHFHQLSYYLMLLHSLSLSLKFFSRFFF